MSCISKLNELSQLNQHPTIPSVPHQLRIFTRGPFGLRVLWSPLCVCVYLCVCHLLLVRTITHHTFQLESPNLNEKMQNILLKVPIVLGADWAWSSMSNLTSSKNSVDLHRFCIFEIFVRRAKTEFVWLFHITHGAAHILILIQHADSVVPWAV